MSTGRLADGVRALGLLTRPPDPRPDAELVTGFVASREEPAFAELVRRHGPTVYGVCRRVLGNGHDADDAFQAVWLVLARRAGAVRPPGAVGAFLYGVAVKVATKAKAQAAKRRHRLMAAAKPDVTVDAPDWSDLGPVLDAELATLPEKYRQAVVLCDLSGKSRSEAAVALGWPEGTVAARVAKGRALLADRLRRRGITLSSAALAGLLTPTATACPVPAAVQSLALDVLAGPAASAVPPAVQLLAEGVVRPMKTPMLVMLTAGLLTAAGLTAGAMLGGNGNGPGWERPPDGPAADGPPAFGPWELQAVLKDHGQLVYAAAFAPDGRTFSTIGADSTLIVWDAATRTKKHSYPVTWSADSIPAVPASPPDPPGGPGVKLPPWRWLQYTPDGYLFVLAQTPGGIDYHYLDPASGARLDAGERPGGGRNTGLRMPGVLAVSADGKKLMTVGAGIRVLPRTNEGKSVVLEKSADPNNMGHSGLPTAVTLGPDGKWIALIELIVDKEKNEIRHVVRVCDADTGKTAATLPCVGFPNAVAWSPDGKWLAAAAGQEARLWTTGNWATAAVPKPPYMNAFSVAFTPDSRQLLLGYWQSERGFWSSKQVNRVGTWSVPGMQQHQYLDVNPDEGVIAMAVSPDGKALVAAVGNHLHAPNVGPHADPEFRRKNGEVRVFTRKPLVKPALPPKTEEKPKADDGPERNQDLWVWQQRIVPEAEGGKVPRTVAFTPDGKFLVTGGDKRKVQFWTLSTNPLRSNELSLSSSSPDEATTAVAVAPNGKTVAFTRANGVTVMDPDPRHLTLGPPRGKPLPPDWEKLNPAPPPAPPGEKVFKTFQTPGPPPRAIAFSPDGRRLAWTDGRGVWVRGLDDGGGEVSMVVPDLADQAVRRLGTSVAAVAFSPDGKRVLYLPNTLIDPEWVKAAPPGSTADPAKATHFYAQIWGAGSGEAMALLVHGKARLTAAVWSADGKRIATADEAGEVVIWDGETFKERKRVKVGGPVTALALRADGQRFAAGVTTGDAPQVVVYTVQDGSDPDNWQPSSKVGLPAGARATSVAFSPDGKVLAAGTADGLHVWDRVKLAPK